MAKKYARPLVPLVFEAWVEERRKNLEKMARKAGRRKPVSKIEAMEIISQTEGINLPEEVFRKLTRMIRC